MDRVGVFQIFIIYKTCVHLVSVPECGDAFKNLTLPLQPPFISSFLYTNVEWTRSTFCQKKWSVIPYAVRAK